MALISTEYSRELLSSLTLSSETYKTLKLTCDCGLFVADIKTDLNRLNVKDYIQCTGQHTRKAGTRMGTKYCTKSYMGSVSIRLSLPVRVWLRKTRLVNIVHKPRSTTID